MPTPRAPRSLGDLRRRDAPAFYPVDVMATRDGRVQFGVGGPKRTPAEALRFAAHVRQVAIEAQRRKEGPRAD